ncbi:hypothetical protein F4677DRAFT_71363 [Hypoxylon crocopeplum]|nr:hypothetical protein F4677DRAFT_71363 [Hypoxylon crocopeplum]
MEADHVDKLLERYLHLLHEYTTLREQLNGLQTGIYQNIARANFAAERGMRFGQDYYDDRMQASRRVAITTTSDQDSAARFAVLAMEEEHVEAESAQAAQAADPPGSEKGVTVGGDDDDTVSDGNREGMKDGDTNTPSRKKPKDPLRWFGLLTPMALRQAQAQGVEAVEHVIPKLVSVNAQMAQVEIEVRRARKKRAKTEAAAAKKEQEVGVGTEIAA